MNKLLYIWIYNNKVLILRNTTKVPRLFGKKVLKMTFQKVINCTINLIQIVAI